MRHRIIFLLYFWVEQFYRCKYYYKPEEHIVTRFFKGLNFHIQIKMPTYTIYTLHNAIHLATQIESKCQRDFIVVIKRIDEVIDLIKQMCFPKIVPDDIRICLPILEMPQDGAQLILICVLQLTSWLRLNNLFQLRKNH